MNFLEAVFSFLFGDGNPNSDLEERRWKAIGTVIRNNQGAVVAEQIAPYLDKVGQGYAHEYEEYMLPVLSRFDGRPEVSPEGDIVYHFPELQTTVAEQRYKPVSAYLKEFPWQFSRASSGQIILAIGLGAVLLIGALALGKLLVGGIAAAKIGGLVAFVQSIYWLLLGYGTAFLSIPFIRYFWIQWRNKKSLPETRSGRKGRYSLTWPMKNWSRRSTTPANLPLKRLSTAMTWLTPQNGIMWSSPLSRLTKLTWSGSAASNKARKIVDLKS